MRLNENLQIVGTRVLLVPYEAKHVEKYHEWMKSPELQELTASEPLTLEEEYEMQRNWRNDDDKCTFLILCRETYERASDEICALVGDTNLFLREEEDYGVVGEAEIMIAEESARGKGYGRESMLLLLKYGQLNLNISVFEVKIGIQNVKSLRMFSKMHFQEVSRSDIFQEVTLRCNVTTEWINWLDSQVSLVCQKYKH